MCERPGLARLSLIDEGMRLRLHGEVNFGTVPHLEGVLDAVVALGPTRLTIDLSDTTGVSVDALAAIVRRHHDVASFVIELPATTHSTVLWLVSNGSVGQAPMDRSADSGAGAA